jgi:hypothetical protein
MAEQEKLYQSFISWQPHTVTVYKSSVENIGKRVDNGLNLKSDRKKAYKGQVTKKTRVRYEKLLTAWMNVLKAGNENKGNKKRKIVMITLTLSDKQDYNKIGSDKMIKKNMLEPMIKWLQYNFDVVNFFWRAEAQANGNIHFHILLDKYINKEKLQLHWNKIQEKHGYLETYKRKFKKTNPPSTHVKLYDLTERNIGYILKYLTKENDRRLIEGLQFRASNALTHLKIPSQAIEKNDEIGLINKLHDKSSWQHYDEFFIVFKFDFAVDEVFGLSDKYKLVGTYYSVCYDIMYNSRLSSIFVHLLNLYYSNISKYRMLYNQLASIGADVLSFAKLLDKYNLVTV